MAVQRLYKTGIKIASLVRYDGLFFILQTMLMGKVLYAYHNLEIILAVMGAGMNIYNKKT